MAFIYFKIDLKKISLVLYNNTKNITSRTYCVSCLRKSKKSMPRLTLYMTYLGTIIADHNQQIMTEQTVSATMTVISEHMVVRAGCTCGSTSRHHDVTCDMAAAWHSIEPDDSEWLGLSNYIFTSKLIGCPKKK